VRTRQPGKDFQVWFVAEARIGQKGRNGHRWWRKGERAPGLADKRLVAHLPLCVSTDDAFALVLPEVQNTHAIVLLDQAGHREKALAVPVGGAIHSIKSGRISLPREASLKVV
jgi:hypothetical protein